MSAFHWNSTNRPFNILSFRGSGSPVTHWWSKALFDRNDDDRVYWETFYFICFSKRELSSVNRLSVRFWIRNFSENSNSLKFSTLRLWSGVHSKVLKLRVVFCTIGYWLNAEDELRIQSFGDTWFSILNLWQFLTGRLRQIFGLFEVFSTESNSSY